MRCFHLFLDGEVLLERTSKLEKGLAHFTFVHTMKKLFFTGYMRKSFSLFPHILQKRTANSEKVSRIFLLPRAYFSENTP